MQRYPMPVFHPASVMSAAAANSQNLPGSFDRLQAES
jgi:hypothetical protein